MSDYEYLKLRRNLRKCTKQYQKALSEYKRERLRTETLAAQLQSAQGVCKMLEQLNPEFGFSVVIKTSRPLCLLETDVKFLKNRLGWAQTYYRNYINSRPLTSLPDRFICRFLNSWIKANAGEDASSEFQEALAELHRRKNARLQAAREAGLF